jgi:hypothetical protein
VTAFLRIFFLIPIGYILAVIAATAVLLVGSTGGTPLDQAERYVYSLIGAIFVGGFSVLPMAVAIIASEVWRWRSILIWLAIGGGIGLAGWLLPGASAEAQRFDAYVPVYLAAGFAGGLVYWLIAGRRAGAGFSRRDDLAARG